LTLNITGLDKLSGFSINSARVVIPKEADGTNLVGEAILPNHSVFTFALVCLMKKLRAVVDTTNCKHRAM
jgi:hypothetical protein